MANSNSEDPKELQSDMFLMLDDNLQKGSEELRQWKICLNPYLQPVNLKETMSASEICSALLSKGSISLGDYSRLIKTVKKVDCPLADDILRQEQHIKDVMSSNKTASTECDKAFDTECNKTASTECDKTSSTECDGPYTNTKATVKHKVHAPVEDPKELQSDMFLMLDDNLQKGSEKLRQWKICLNPYLQPVNLKETMSASEICSALLSKGSISLGDYSRLIKTVKKVDCPLADDILRQEQHIKDVMSSNKTASTECDKAFDTECNKTASTECDKTSSTECDGPYTNTKATVKHKVPAPVEDPKELQSDVFLMLDDNLYKGSEKLRQWKICLKPYLQPVNLKETMSASEICFALLSKGSISLGDYSRLIETVKKVDCPLADDILRQEQHIKDVMSSNKTASTECDKAFDTECNKTASTECDGPYTNTKATVKHKVHAPVDVSLDLLFDFVASKLSNEMLRLAAELPLKRDHVDAIKHNNPNNIHEQNFQILYLWKCQKSPSDGECIERLKQALKENDRQDIVDDIDDFNKQDYRVSGICNPEQPVKDMDINKVATNINQRYTSLARFLGVPQRDLEQIQNDCRNDIREQAAQALNKWKRRSQTTRQWLCDGLNYANHRDIIDMLKEKW